MTSKLASRVERLERARDADTSGIFIWTGPDNPDAEPEVIDLCGLTHEECLELLDAEDRLQ